MNDFLIFAILAFTAGVEIPVLCPTEVQLYRNTTGEIMCNYTAPDNLVQSISWTFNGADLISTSDSAPLTGYSVGEHGTLTIIKAQKEQEGNYSLIIASRHPNFVFGKPNILVLVKETPHKEEVKCPKYIEVTSGDPFIISCNYSKTYKILQRYWVKDGKALEETSEHYKQMTNGDLSILQAELTDEGNYSLLITPEKNVVSFAISITMVIIIEPLEIPKNKPGVIAVLVILAIFIVLMLLLLIVLKRKGIKEKLYQATFTGRIQMLRLCSLYLEGNDHDDIEISVLPEYNIVPSTNDNKEQKRTIRVLLVGKTGAGKSSTGNTFIGKETFKIAEGFPSGSKKMQKGVLQTGNRFVEFLDTPGILDTDNDPKTLGELGKFDFFLPDGEGIDVFAFVHNITEIETAKSFISEAEKYFGEKFKHFAVAIFTHSDDEDHPFCDLELRKILNTDDYNDKQFVEVCNYFKQRVMKIENIGKPSKFKKKLSNAFVNMADKLIFDNSTQVYRKEDYIQAQQYNAESETAQA